MIPLLLMASLAVMFSMAVNYIQMRIVGLQYKNVKELYWMMCVVFSFIWYGVFYLIY